MRYQWTEQTGLDYCQHLQTASCTPVDTTCTPPGWSAPSSPSLSGARRLEGNRYGRLPARSRRRPKGAQAMIDDGLFDRFPEA